MLSLHDYQLRAVQHVIDNHAAGLILDMGLGKTASTLIAVNRLIIQGDTFKVLIIAPKRVAEHTWTQERDKWCPSLGMSVIAGTESQRMRAVMSHEPVHVIGRDNLPWLVDTFSKKWPYEMLVIDESSSFKNPASKRFKALKKVRQHFERVVILTGTPSPNSLLELWPQVWLLDKGERLGRTFTAFKQAFFTSDYMGWKFEPKQGAEVDIHNRLSDICMSMKASDYLSLPDRVDNVIRIELSKSERNKYERLKRDFVLTQSDAEITASNAAVLCGKLLQLSGGAIYDDDKNVVALHNKKIDALSEIIEAANGRPVLVFYQFKHELERIKEAIPEVEELDVPRFMEGKQAVALAHPASAGHGLNLQSGSSEMVWFSVPWSLELYQQANARLHRQGQTKTVVIHHLIASDTIDEEVMQALSDKATTQDRLINALKWRLQ